jgi:amino acid adenylation domain-containing protein
VGITDDFFRIGGNSILAIRLVSLLNISLGVQLSVKDIFKYKTVGKLSAVIEATTGGFKYGDYQVTAGFTGENEAFELSNVQQAYLYGRMDSFELGNVSTHGYSELLFTRFDGDRFEQALNKLIVRHGALRTIFKHEQQYILEDTGHYTVKNHGKVTVAGLDDIRGRLSHKVYQADQWPLFDFEVSEHEGRAILHGSFDALIMDATSTGLFFKELGQLYGAADMEKVQLPVLQLNFKDYMQQYGEVRAGKLFAEAEQYWSGKIEEYDFEARLPMVVNPASISHPRFARLSGTVPQEQWQKIEDKAKQYDMSPTSVVLYAYGHILTKWSGHSRFTINLTLFNRLPLHEQVNDILGDFTVLELFNFKRKTQDTIHSALQEVHGELWNDIEHNLFDGIDFQRLIRRQAGISQNQSLSPVVLTSVLGNNHTDIRLDGYEGTGYSITQTSQVYLDNRVYNTPEGFVAEWDYVEQLFDPEVIGQMHADYCRLITQLAEADWASAMPELSLSATDEKVIREANSHTQPQVKETLTGLCQAGISQYPDNIAITDKTGSYTYKETGAYSYHIAGCLQENKHAQPGQLIGILSKKGHQQVIAALGIMQSGAAYLPLHVEWPVGRIDEVLQEGQVKTVLVSQLQYESCIKGSQIASTYEWLVIEETKDYQPKLTQEELHKPKPEDIAYVIFTSGSTGKPKGVTISHSGAANTIVAVNNRLSINSEDKVLALSELSFDLSVYDMFGLLAAGGTVVFPDQEKTKEPAHWYELIKANGITLWDTVPQLMQLLADYVSHKKEDLGSLKAVMMSGDWIPVKLPGQVKALSPEATVMSLGGATEGSIWSIWYEITATDPSWSAIPYGQAMPNQKMYVLDGFGEHSPAGVRGEIYIGGEGVALGYWNDEQKTSASFISHPQLGRLYKTGDLGKWNKAGYIEFEGRKDNQVKLNGYRVELDEIAAKLTNIKGIDKSIVAIQDNQLVAYLVAEQAKAQPESQATDKVSFKFEQQGIRKDLQPEHEIKGLQLNEKHYRLRKSYRQFEEGGISLSKAELLAIQHKSLQQQSLNGKVQSWPDRLKHLLEPLSAMQLPDKVLPKYLYPSGGSTYAIQCYAVIPQDIENIKQGCYYYEPVAHYLAKVNDIAHNNGTAPIKLQFKLYKPAIEPLYGEMAIKLAWLELGHILALLQQQLQSMNLFGQLTLTDTAEDDYHAMAEVGINLNANGQAQLLTDANEIDYLTKDGDGFSDGEGHRYGLSNLDLFTRISELGQVVTGAQGLILFRGTAAPESLLRSGYQAQQLAEQLYGQDTGSCTLGFIPYEGLNYSMAIGAITPQQKAEPESQAKKVSAEAYIKQQLEKYLPAYMLPDYFISLKELPLTANGKVDYRQLPKVQIVQDEYVAPVTEAERRICAIWQEVLGLERVGITDDFFRIGGNSILAIQVTHQMSSALACEMKVADVFKLRTIHALLENTETMEVGEENITMVF